MHVSGQRVEMNCKVKTHDEHQHGTNPHMIPVNDFQVILVVVTTAVWTRRVIKTLSNTATITDTGHVGLFCAFTVNGNGHVSEVCKDKTMMKYCQIDKGPDGVEMSCKSDFNFTHWLDNYKICEMSQSLNDPSCNHTRRGLASQHDCYFCCQSEECFRNVFNLPKPTTTAASTTAASTPLTSATPTDCYTDSGWACQSEEFCALTIGSSDLVMICQDISSTWEGCVSEQDQNAESCSPTLTSTEGPDCHYCCKSEQCFADLLLHTDHLVTTEAPSKDCIQSGQWACESHEFCALKFGSYTTIKCEDINSHWQNCINDGISGVLCDRDKLSGAEFSECSYCCRDLNCIMGLLRPSVPTTTPTPSSTYWTRATTSQQTVTEAPPDTKTCIHNGAWACQTDEPVYHGSLHSTKTGDDNTGTSDHNPVNIPGSTDHNPINNIPGSTDNSSNSDDKQAIGDVSAARTQQLLHFCRIRTYIATGELAMDCLPATGTELLVGGQTRNNFICTFYIPINTHVVTGTLYVTVHLNNRQCRHAITSRLFFRNAISSSTDVNHANTADNGNLPSTQNFTTIRLAGSCADSFILQLCPKTCDTCATGDCVDTYVGDCSKDFAGRCSESYIMEICAKSCGTCGICAICSGLDCFIMDPSGKQCPQTQPFCMTSVTDTQHGRDDIIRRCASKADCDAIPLQEKCRHAETILHMDIICKFCCNQANCNAPPSVIPQAGLITNHV
ncbi:hypothetical protein BaRGS_00021513 [Batillaria attramentaria]|uniref:Uncharacterized protein n=1 Tax=Batillaria attramentaria TaxID=370345 RepID=A0ABD0KKH2_9CAEN